MEQETKRRLAFINSLLFETPGGIRFTQDSPILPNVWLAFAMEPHKQHELILTTVQDGGTGLAAQKIREMLNNLRDKRAKGKDPLVRAKSKRLRPRVSYIPGQIAVKLYFDELMRVVLPLTPWWHRIYRELRKLEARDVKGTANVANWRRFPQKDEDGAMGQCGEDLKQALMLMRREINAAQHGDEAIENSSDRQKYIRDIPPDLTWMVRIGGLVSRCFLNAMILLEEPVSRSLEQELKLRHGNQWDPDVIENDAEQQERLENAEKAAPIQIRADKLREEIVDAFMELYRDWNVGDKYPDAGMIWRVTKNRPIRLAVNRSALTVKADAAARLFNVSCKNITWAVIDSGIDPTHEAFRKTSPEYEMQVRQGLRADRDKALEKSEEPERGEDELRLEDLEETRIVKTLDFTRLREMLDHDIELDSKDKHAKAQRKKIAKQIAERMPGKNPRDNMEAALGVLDELRRRIRDGKDISWQDMQMAIVDHNPEVPVNDHGTHVAGILGADWIDDLDHEYDDPLPTRKRRMQGVCPDINLIDVRVFRSDGLTDEFELLAAMQYLRWMNSRAGTMQVHGANLSLSLIHEVRRFACGRTPICEECNEAAALGMVVVAAAGNRGFEMTDMEEIRASDSYRSVSITDPGNAQGVITVGATHRKRPHEYGVSYFSSRGPTGDGRLKPDVVAPGEKIRGPTPGNRAEFKDGTSMAAPHVSGAAALLMARHSELIGQPERIKQIICDTATDLGRERYFQGHGLVDVLRAMQSV